MNRFAFSIFAALLALASPAWAGQSAPGVVTSIKPVHSLVSAVMEGAGTPHLIVRGLASPHGYSMRPSDATALQKAKLVFWIGPDFEIFLRSPLEAVSHNPKLVALVDAPGVEKLLLKDRDREGGHDEHGHDDHGHKKEAKHEHGHDDHGHKKEAKHEHGHDDHDHKKEAKDEHGHDDHDHKKEAKHEHGHEEHAKDEHGDDHHGHDHGDSPYDMHLWLDPQNAIAIVKAAEKALSEADPDNAELYSKNASKTVAAINDLMTKIKGELAGLSKRPFIVFHDAYAYFENRFGLEASAAIALNPEVQPGAKRVSDIQNRIREKGIVCVFAEPQFPSKLVSLVTEGTNAKTGELDPLGSRNEAGPAHYTALIRQMADSFRSCLSS